MRAMLVWSAVLALTLCAGALAAAPAAAPVAPTAAAPAAGEKLSEEGFAPIFNGKDLTGWEGNPKLWSAKDGVIRGETTTENPTKGNTFLIWKAGTVEDFEIRFSFRMKTGNSGFQYRSKDVGNWVVSGYQFEVTNGPGSAGFLYHEKGRGSLCRCGEKVTVDEAGKNQVAGSVNDIEKIKSAFKLADWNECRIIAQGNHIQHFINGVQTIDVTDNDEKGRSMSGIVALQIHAGPPMLVEFKDIRVKKLPAAAGSTETAKPAAK